MKALAEVCIDYSGVTYADEATLTLNHFENDVWLDVTTSLDMEADIICGTVSSFSPFVLFEVSLVQPVTIDLSPKSCQNILMVKNKKKHHWDRMAMPVAILGSEVLDVAQIDPESLHLNGVDPVRHPKKGQVKVKIKDIRTASLATKTGKKGGTVERCKPNKKDEFKDLSIRFNASDLVDALEAQLGRELVDGETLDLILTGQLLDGTEIEGQDQVLIKKPGTKRH